MGLCVIIPWLLLKLGIDSFGLLVVYLRFGYLLFVLTVCYFLLFGDFRGFGWFDFGCFVFYVFTYLGVNCLVLVLHLVVLGLRIEFAFDFIDCLEFI